MFNEAIIVYFMTDRVVNMSLRDTALQKILISISLFQEFRKAFVASCSSC